MVTTFVGPNGCGKTTLLKVINGFLKPGGGAVYIEGQDVQSLAARDMARTIGHVSQIHKMSFPFSVKEVVLTGRMPYVPTFSLPRKEDVERTMKSLALLGIEHLAHRPYTRISGGERQLVMISRALAQEPAFLILDEPTSSLDFKNQINVLKTVKELAHSTGLTVLMSLHDPNHALMFSDQIVLLRKLEFKRANDGEISRKNMYRGNLVAHGPPFEVMTSENVKLAYGIDVEIIEHQGRRIMLPL